MNRLTLLFVLMSASFLVGCQTWRPWHKKSNAEPKQTEMAEDTETKTSMDSVTEELSGFSKAFRGESGGDSGTGLSDRSRDIEKRLGYR
ncbi:MAG: hypothetical protein ACIALR_10345 [Blastopirellula sp. JB062]